MTVTPRYRQIAWLAIAAGLLAAGGLVQQRLSSRALEAELVEPNNMVDTSHPGLTVLTVVPGGLRAPVINYLWIRAQKYKEAGRIYDAAQLADAICRLMPRFAGVWGFHAWNMAWNISVATHTPDERWKWVSNGMKLLRDEGIPRNPKVLELYRELGWLLFSKMGGTTDEMHMVYKRRWAGEMQRLLGAPPAGSTQEVIDAFRPIAEAPVDYGDTDRTSGIQPDQLEMLLSDPLVAEYAELLAELDIRVDASLLEVYNRLGEDPSVSVVRDLTDPPSPRTPREQRLYDLLNDRTETYGDRFAEARAKMVAFVRAQLLWNEYNMDPRLMLELMADRLNAPLDWRLVWPHAIYWVYKGLKIAEAEQLSDVHTLNADRIILNSLKDLTWYGRMTYRHDPANPESPQIWLLSDWRYFEPTHAEHLRIIEQIRLGGGDNARPFEDNILRGGHSNYIINAMGMLVAGRRLDEARTYYDFLRDEYKMEGEDYLIPDVEDFVIRRLFKDGEPIAAVVWSQITVAVQTGLVALAQGNEGIYEDSFTYARRIYEMHQRTAPERLKFRVPFTAIMGNIAGGLIVEPRQYGYNLDILARSDLYNALPDTIQLPIYHQLEAYLRQQAEQAGLDFATAFPAPKGLDEWRERLRRQQQQDLGTREGSEVRAE